MLFDWENWNLNNLLGKIMPEKSELVVFCGFPFVIELSEKFMHRKIIEPSKWYNFHNEV